MDGRANQLRRVIFGSSVDYLTLFRQIHHSPLTSSLCLVAVKTLSVVFTVCIALYCSQWLTLIRGASKKYPSEAGPARMHTCDWDRRHAVNTISRSGRIRCIPPLLLGQWWTGGRKIAVLCLLLGSSLQRTHAQATGASTSFSYTGTVQTYFVPAGVTSITVTAAGAQGGQSGTGTSAFSYAPGQGGLIVSTVSVTPLSTLYVYVGGAGRSGQNTNKGGFNGGGDASYDSFMQSWGGGGGGASDVRTVLGSLPSRVVVAGGGGGEQQTLVAPVV